MTIVAPSILSADFANLERDLNTIAASGTDWVHVDVMDGMFVPNISLGFPVLEGMRSVTRLFLDVHMMVERPIRYVERFCKAGADLVTIHLEADTRENTHKALELIRAQGKKTGISIKPGTPARELEEFLTEVNLILVMTVEPGFGGQKFMADMMPKLTYLRSRLDEVNPRCVLEVDGGIDRDTAPIVRKAGAEILVSGSSYFKEADKAAYVADLTK